MPAELPYVNFGDALSPIVVSAISGRRLRKIPFVSPESRLSGIGTIAQNFAGGTVRIWGTGLDVFTRGSNVDEAGYHLPPRTRFRIAATRGRLTKERLASLGLQAPDVYGDPGWFANRIWPEYANEEKIYDFGLVLHLTEWSERRPGASLRPGLRRYDIPPDLAARVTFINPIAERSVDGVGEVVRRICQCRRILSTSLHGIVVAEAFGIPALFFGATAPYGPQDMAIDDIQTHRLDHRMADFYSILKRESVPAIAWPRQRPLDWHQVLEWCDRQAPFFEFDPKPLFDAFPYRKVVRFEDERWPVRSDLLVDGDFL